MTDKEEIFNYFRDRLFADADLDWSEQTNKPLLAHYTSVQNLERILVSNEFWFSNPLFMNDWEEIRFGTDRGYELIHNNPDVINAIVKACGSNERAQKLIHEYDNCVGEFVTAGAIDTYVFCLSKHEVTDNDGSLSMWRGYGANGEGVAIVFNSAVLPANKYSPLLFAHVDYGSAEKRIAKLTDKFYEFAALLESKPVPDDRLFIPAALLFERIKIFSLCNKHSAFEDERESRVIYIKKWDATKALHDWCGYAVYDRGVEPKLKLKIERMPIPDAKDVSFDEITDRIILGPTKASELAKTAFLRMLDCVKQPNLKGRVHNSKIPFRGNIR